MEDDYSFANGAEFIESLRSAGYRNTATALGELIDNSIQAGARRVDIVALDQEVQLTNVVRQLHRIAVIDDGDGMTQDLLRRALRLGDGTRGKAQDGMGKFGVGLPQASISQAKRVEVFSWQGGIKNTYWTYIDLDDKTWLDAFKVPKPVKKAPPKEIMEASGIRGDSGTVILWSNLDRVTWRRALTLFKHSEFLIGRMYRNWLHPGSRQKVKLRFIHKLEKDSDLDIQEYRANDPLYLMAGTSVATMLPSNVQDPMFEPFGETIKKEFRVKGKKETVTLRFSVARPETRHKVNNQEAGHAEHGKHARENVGVSIVREGRELELDSKFITHEPKDPRHRWWGAEISFGRGLDDIFGVTNNKQHAHALSNLADRTWEDFMQPGENRTEVMKRLDGEDPALRICLEIVEVVQKNIERLAKKVATLGPAEGNRRRYHEIPSAEEQGTERTKQRRDTTGRRGSSDAAENKSREEGEWELARLKEEGTPESQVDEVRTTVLDHGLKYAFVPADTDSSAFFSPSPKAGAIIIKLNTAHKAYKHFFEGLFEENPAVTLTPQEELYRSRRALQLLLEAWSRMEDEATSPEQRNRLRDIRNEWGSIAEDFLD